MISYRIVIVIPGAHRFVGAEVVLADLARKLRGYDFSAGQHELLVYESGAVAVNGELVWQPKPSAVARRAG